MAEPQKKKVRIETLHSDSVDDVATASNYKYVRVTHYHLDFQISFERKEIKGNARLLMKCLKSCNHVTLDTHHTMFIHEVIYKNQSVEFEVAPYTAYGSALHIPLSCSAGDEFELAISYTAGNGPGICWLEPAQTAGKCKPYLYCLGFPVHNRALFPSTDTPSVKSTFSASVKVPTGFSAVMSADRRGKGTEPNIYSFSLELPVTSYLICLAVGDIVSVDIGPRSAVYTEPCLLEKARQEFEGSVEDYIQAGERLFGPYVWGRYDVLVMPPSFPFGGMENPCLTVITPCVLVGDGSMSDVVMHEISHSWFGNLVTHAAWTEFWMNEGFTMYAQRCICHEVHGEALTCLEAATGRALLKNRYKEAGESHPLNKLRVALDRNIDLEEIYNEVPYEKGYAFVTYLEYLAGSRTKFCDFLKAYCIKFKHKSVVAEDLLDFFLDFFPELKQQGVENKSGFEFTNWLNDSSWPPYVPDLSAGESLMKPAEKLAYKWMGVGNDENESNCVNTDISNWNTYQIVHFLDQIVIGPNLPDGTMDKLCSSYKTIVQTDNAEVRLRWSQLVIKHEYKPQYPNIEQFLQSQGKLKYTLPIYLGLWRGSEECRKLAEKIFAETKDQLHLTVRKNVSRILSS
ncbi:LOW QUALITY PROTEIN: aminopeptidase B-like [Amphiura filiformis]|uniref:LOW QUALITY PROTEIN: aminopeptidase B-like n=1 Tax=Amphiura filiformis TaxID=82378 RepID=UPI003B213FCD